EQLFGEMDCFGLKSPPTADQPQPTSAGVHLQLKVEAPPGFEPGVEVLQTSALPLGDGAVKKQRRVIATRLTARLVQTACCCQRRSACQAEAREASEGWSGKRDSNPRLRPWQGRTLPLSYSRPNPQSTTRPGWLSSGPRLKASR